ncbi:unnamed protein product [Lota lota]
MSSLGARREFKAVPLYFFDQPTARDRSKGTRILHFSLADEGARLAETSPGSSGMNKDNTVNSELNVGERNPDNRAVNPMGAYKDAAPELLGELASLLSQYKWPQEGCIPRGLVNILNCSSQDLTNGVFSGKSQFQVADCAKHTLHLKSRCPVVDKKTPKEVILENMRNPKKKTTYPKLSFERTLKARPDLPTRDYSPNVHKDRAEMSERKRQLRQKQTLVMGMVLVMTNNAPIHLSAPPSTGLTAVCCVGWIVDPAALSYEEPQRSAVWQWVLQRLQSARIPIQLQAIRDRERGLDKPPIVRHYGAVRSNYKNKRTVDKQYPAALINGMPQIPQVKREDQRKLHYGTPDGSSVIYYPSGCVAVCQSGSGLPCRGFYTNVFSDGASSTVIASITAFGRGAVTHPVSGVVSAVWDRGGGIICGPDGTVTKEWSWLSGSGSNERVLIQISDSISVKLLHGTSGLLRFKSQGEMIQLPLSALSNVTPPTDTACVKPNQRLISHRELMLTKSRLIVHSAESRLLPVTTATPRHQEVLQMVREVEGLEEPGVVWGGGGGGGHVEELQRQLKRLQRKVQNTLHDWLEFYRTATGIRCPDIERMPDAQQRSRSRREVRTAALPSLNPPGWEDTQPGPPADPPRHLSAPVTYLLSSSTGEGPRTPRKPLKDESCVTQIGALRVHSNIRLESFIIPESPARPPAGGADVHPVVHPSPPSGPCPALLRATLQGGDPVRDGGPRCCCSSGPMPLVTDLEYDAFVQGQAARSEQVLVVCVTGPGSHDDTLEQLHERRSRNRTAPCVQCQMDPFRLVRYELPAGRTGSARRSLLQIRHNVPPGTLLMYIRGKLLFAKHVSPSSRGYVRDLYQQISTTRRDYRLGLSLPADYTICAKLKGSVAADSLTTQESWPISTYLDSSSTRLSRSHQGQRTSQQEGRTIKRSPAVPYIPLVKH